MAARQPNAEEWAERIRVDLEWLKSNVHPRINRNLRLLGPQQKIRDPNERTQAPWARRIIRAIGSMDFLHRLPHLDAEFLGQGVEDEDKSNEIEDAISLLSDKTEVKKRLRKAQHTCAWSPISWLKCGMPATGIQQDNTMGEGTPDIIETVDSMSPQYEVIEPEVAEAMQLSQLKIPNIEPEFVKESNERPILPFPTTSLDIPWIDWVDPRHVVTERGITEIELGRYIAHLFVMPMSKFSDSLVFKNKSKVEAYYIANDADDKLVDAKEYLGGGLLSSFDIPSSKEVVVLCEVWIREDPEDPRITHRVGILDLMSRTWVHGPRPNPLNIFPWIALRSSDEAPGLWSGPSYIEQAHDDIVEAAWARKKLKQHFQIYASHKDFIPEDIQFDQEEWEKYVDPDYNGPIRYAGNRPPDHKSPPQMPPALIQFWNTIDAQFKRNTGVTGTMSGSGSSNKVATAFRQEERYAEERRDELRFKLYEAYRSAMLICTYLIQRYNLEPVEIKRNGLAFQFGRDIVKGIINYKVDIIDIEKGDPLQDRLVEIQSIERVLANPLLMQQFNLRELAKIIARVNRWGSRVLVAEDPAITAGAGPEEEMQMLPGGAQNRSLGSGVDSAQENGQTGSAVAGSLLRSPGGGGRVA